MATIEMSLGRQEAGDVLSILDGYHPRLTYTTAPRRWWQSDLKVTVAGDEPYLSDAQAEIDAWQEERFLRRAW